MMQIGLVGCGHIGRVHAYALEKLAKAGLIDARLVATARPWQRCCVTTSTFRSKECTDLHGVAMSLAAYESPRGLLRRGISLDGG